MDNCEQFNYTNEANEAKELIEKFLKLQAQINNPTRDGMIEALSDAKSVAGQEISELEISQGETCPTSWSCIPYDYLYRKFYQYQQGLFNHVVNKLGEEAFKKVLKDHAKASQNQ